MASAARKSYVLKVAIFATGLSGIVAEYVLSTLATYFLGDSVLQWTLMVSTMLFAMGLGSRISRLIRSRLLERLIYIEFLLSILVSLSALFVYTISAFTDATGIFIYGLSIAVGLLIGLEIPLVARINEEYEELRDNIAAVMSLDYFGSLLGGLFFAFVGLPYLNLTYTPFVLGIINFSVAIWVLFALKKYLDKPKTIKLFVYGGTVMVLLVIGVVLAKPIVLFGEQSKYKDHIVYQEQSKYQKIVITQWKEHHWLFINGNQQLSSMDEFLYHEPLVHPVMGATPQARRVLILGGGDGIAAYELLKYQNVEKITLVDLDPAMTNLGKEHEILVNLNHGALNDPRVEVLNTDGFQYVEQTTEFFDVILVDLPDPKRVEINKLYTKEFYQLCKRHLRPHGLFITQAGSPYYATKAFKCIDTTMAAAGFNTLPMHNQVLTLGEWGWIIGSPDRSTSDLKQQLLQLDFSNVETRWLTQEAMGMITSFGKDLIEVGSIELNTINNPVLYRYYNDGNWDLYN